MEKFLKDLEFEKYKKLIYDQSGIHFSDSNRVILESRIKERLRISKAKTAEDYFHIITGSEEELKAFLDAVTTNLTRFFRNTANFQTLEYYVIPDLVKTSQAVHKNVIKVWSAGCSTGEEPYSIAIMFKEFLPPNMKAEITASDLSLKSLLHAKAGFYQDYKIADSVPKNYLDKYFERKTNGYQINDEIRNMVRFDYHNLKYDSGLRNLDLVFCRNVIIYFDEAAQNAVINQFWNSMGPYSYLFIGHSESLIGMKTGFQFVKTNWSCIYKKSVNKV